MPSATFSMRMDAKTKKALESEAQRRDRSAAYIAGEAIAAYLDKQAYKRECLLEAAAEADKGVFISEEALDRWMDSWGDENELPPPEPDIFPGNGKR